MQNLERNVRFEIIRDHDRGIRKIDEQNQKRMA